MSSTGLEPTLDSLFCDAMLESLAENLPSPPVSTRLFLSAPITSQGTIPAAIQADNEYILPDKAVAIIFSHLPIKDVFRFGFKLSKGWLDIWKSSPLVLHDAQLVPDHLKVKIVKGGLFRYNIASNITRVLDLHPGPVAYMRLEYTTWKGGNTQVRLWIEKLIKKGVNELILFGRWQPAGMDVLPNNIVHCSHLRSLTLFSFKIPELSLDDPLSLEELRTLTIANCKLTEMDIIILLMRCSNLKLMSIGHIDQEVLTIRSRTLNSLRLWNCRIDQLFIMGSPVLSAFTQMVERDSLHETQITISSTPAIDTISHLYLDQQTLYIDEYQITIGMQDHPKYVALQVLSIGVKFYGNCALDVIRGLLMSFPNLVTLEITRLDPSECYVTELIKWKDLMKGIRCVEHKLQVFCLFNSGLDDTEIELAHSILMYASKLGEFEVIFSRCTSTDARRKLEDVIWGTTPASESLISFQLSMSPA